MVWGCNSSAGIAISCRLDFLGGNRIPVEAKIMGSRTYYLYQWALVCKALNVCDPHFVPDGTMLTSSKPQYENLLL
jgi:hypothetical protein